MNPKVKCNIKNCEFNKDGKCQSKEIELEGVYGRCWYLLGCMTYKERE